MTFGMSDHERQIQDLMVLRDHAQHNEQNLAAVNLIPERNTPVRFAPAGPRRTNGMWLAPDNRLQRDIVAILDRR